MYIVFLSLKVVLILAKSADPDEMQHNAAFHLGLHCLPNYPFRGFQYTKGYILLHTEGPNLLAILSALKKCLISSCY